MLLVISAPLEGENFEKGISSRNLEMAKNFPGNAWIVMTNFSHRTKKKINVDAANQFINETAKNVKLVIIEDYGYAENQSAGRIGFNIRFALKLRDLISRVDRDYVLIVNAIPLEPLAFLTHVINHNCKKLILDIRDIWPDAFGRPQGLKQLGFYSYCLLIKKLIRWSCVDLIWCVAPSFKEWLPPSLKARSYFLPLGFDSVRWVSAESGFSEVNWLIESKRSGFKLKLLYIGYFSNQFDLDPILKYADQHGDEVHIDLIGGGSKLEKYEETYSKSENISFYGDIDPRRLPTLVLSLDSHFGLIPLRIGAGARMPNKLFDYIALRLPVISFNSTDAAEYIEDNNLGLSFDFHDLDSGFFRSAVERFDYQSCKNSLISHRDSFSMQSLYSNIFE